MTLEALWSALKKNSADYVRYFAICLKNACVRSIKGRKPLVYKDLQSFSKIDTSILDEIEEPNKTLLSERYVHRMTLKEMAEKHKLSPEGVRKMILRAISESFT